MCTVVGEHISCNVLGFSLQIPVLCL